MQVCPNCAGSTVVVTCTSMKTCSNRTIACTNNAGSPGCAGSLNKCAGISVGVHFRSLGGTYNLHDIEHWLYFAQERIPEGFEKSGAGYLAQTRMYL